MTRTSQITNYVTLPHRSEGHQFFFYFSKQDRFATCDLANRLFDVTETNLFAHLLDLGHIMYMFTNLVINLGSLDKGLFGKVLPVVEHIITIL